MKPAEYDCEGCGVHVFGFGRSTSPEDQLCGICEWVNRYEEPERIMETRRRCEPGGWEPERAQRGIPARALTPKV